MFSMTRVNMNETCIVVKTCIWNKYISTSIRVCVFMYEEACAVDKFKLTETRRVAISQYPPFLSTHGIQIKAIDKFLHALCNAHSAYGKQLVLRRDRMNNDCIYQKCASANIVDLDQTPQNAASDLGLHYLPHIKLFLDTSQGSRTSRTSVVRNYGVRIIGKDGNSSVIMVFVVISKYPWIL